MLTILVEELAAAGRLDTSELLLDATFAEVRQRLLLWTDLGPVDVLRGFG